MKKVEKGEFGYLAYKKSRNMIKTIIAFAIVLVIFIIGFIIWKSKNNYLTMLAVVLVLPAAKFAVSYFVLIPHKNCDEELKNAIEKCKGELNSVYDLVVSNKQKPVGIMAAVISDNQILAYTSSAKADKNLFETSVKEFLKNEKLTCAVLLYVYTLYTFHLPVLTAFIYFLLHFLHSVYIRHFNFPAVDW